MFRERLISVPGGATKGQEGHQECLKRGAGTCVRDGPSVITYRQPLHPLNPCSVTGAGDDSVPVHEVNPPRAVVLHQYALHVKLFGQIGGQLYKLALRHEPYVQRERLRAEYASAEAVM